MKRSSAWIVIFSLASWQCSDDGGVPAGSASDSNLSEGVSFAEWVITDIADAASLQPDAAGEAELSVQPVAESSDAPVAEIPEADVPPELPMPDETALGPDISDAVDSADTRDVADAYHFPEVTDDCEPLGLPTAWAGTFDGEITSNLPDMMGYTFNGPVYGDMAFEIKCINSKLVVIGTLEGTTDNCALVTGCPFTATLGGFYNTQTEHLHGQIVDGTIDFAAVIIHAEGEFDGDLQQGPELAGGWFGTKTSIDNLLLPQVSLEWVDAAGEGTWSAQPVTQ